MAICSSVGRDRTSIKSRVVHLLRNHFISFRLLVVALASGISGMYGIASICGLVVRSFVYESFASRKIQSNTKFNTFLFNYSIPISQKESLTRMSTCDDLTIVWSTMGIAVVVLIFQDFHCKGDFLVLHHLISCLRRAGSHCAQLGPL